MLVVCNGAAKSGSTWLYNIVQNLADFNWPEARYITHSNTKHPTIKEIHLSAFLRESDIERRNIISKNHYGKVAHRKLLLSSSHTRIVDMSRDSRDVIVSAYYDRRRRDGYQGSFEDYYWQSGRLLVNKLKRYHDVWSRPHPHIMVTSYEALKLDFCREVIKIADFLDVRVDKEDLARIRKVTNIDSLRVSYRDDAQYNTEGNSFFRKGEVGDWKNHFDPRMINDYERIEHNGIGKFDLAYLQTRIRQNLNRIFA